MFNQARPGALAQLVERLLCKQDVIGSNPLGSTNSRRHDQTAPSVLSRPVGRRLPSGKPFNIVQRDNQRCRLHPREDAAAEGLRTRSQRRRCPSQVH